jgi:O-antigen/teichoic acid export membrane protein
MSLLRSVARNTALQASGKAIGTALGFVVATVLFRYLKDELYGNYTTAMSYLQLFGIVMDLGLYVVLLKHISSADNADGKLQNNIFTFRAVSAIGLLMIAVGSVWFIPAYPLVVKWAVVVLAVNFFCITMNQLFQAIFQQHLAMHWVAISEVTSKIVLFVSTLTVVYLTEANVLAIMGTVVLSGAVQTLLLWIASRRYAKLKLAFDFAIWKRVLSESWPIAIAIALNLIYFKSDTIILSIFHSQQTVGIYGVPYKMLEVLITLPAMVVGLLMPILSQHYQAKDFPAFAQLYQRSINLLWMLGAPMVLGGMVLAQPFMQLLAGDEFTSDPAVLGALFRILILAVGAIYVGTLTGYVVVAVDRQKSIIFAYAFVAVTALAGYLLLIPRYSYFGAAWVTVYSETMMLLISLVVIYRATRALPAFGGLLRISLAAVIMAIGVYLVQAWPLWMSLLIGAMLYVGALLVVKGITPEEIKTILRRQPV